MKPINVEIIMGHSIGISASYYRPLKREVLEDYLKAVPLLALGDNNYERHQQEQQRDDKLKTLRQQMDMIMSCLFMSDTPDKHMEIHYDTP